MRKKRPPTLCAYCGKREATTLDHIPPRSLFPRPRPKNLLTIPACEKCHKAFNKDDEYFKLILAMKRETGNHPKRKGLLEGLHRGLLRPEGRALAHSVVRTLREVQLRTPGGILLGNAAAYQPDWNRLEAVAARVVRGLFWKEYGHPVPSDHEVRVQPILQYTDGLVNEAAVVFAGRERRGDRGGCVLICVY